MLATPILAHKKSRRHLLRGNDMSKMYSINDSSSTETGSLQIATLPYYSGGIPFTQHTLIIASPADDAFPVGIFCSPSSGDSKTSFFANSSMPTTPSTASSSRASVLASPRTPAELNAAGTTSKRIPPKRRLVGLSATQRAYIEELKSHEDPWRIAPTPSDVSAKDDASTTSPTKSSVSLYFSWPEPDDPPPPRTSSRTAPGTAAKSPHLTRRSMEARRNGNLAVRSNRSSISSRRSSIYLHADGGEEGASRRGSRTTLASLVDGSRSSYSVCQDRRDSSTSLRHLLQVAARIEETRGVTTTTTTVAPILSPRTRSETLRAQASRITEELSTSCIDANVQDVISPRSSSNNVNRIDRKAANERPSTAPSHNNNNNPPLLSFQGLKSTKSISQGTKTKAKPRPLRIEPPYRFELGRGGAKPTASIMTGTASITWWDPPTSPAPFSSTAFQF